MSNFLSVLIPFLFIHILCDFYLQPNRWKATTTTYTYRSPKLYFHALLHGVALVVPAFIVGVGWQSTVCLVAIVTISHFVIDVWKRAEYGDRFSYFVINQTLHGLILTVIAFHIAEGVTITEVLEHENFSSGMLVILSYLLILKPTSIVISGVLRKYPISEIDSNTNMVGIVAGGELIGYLERVLILTFTLVGSYAAVGFVLAAKSIFRFGELNKTDNRSMAEYVLIGSLLSVTITTILGTLLALNLDLRIE